MVALVGAVACTSELDPDLSDSEKGEEMRFEVGAITRATTITTASNLTKQSFRLFGAAYKNNEFISPGFRILFNNKEVIYSNGKWEYGTKEYWEMGQEHSFVAIHPYDIPGIDTYSYSTVSNPDYPDSKESTNVVTFRYSLPQDDNKVKDVVVATHRRKYTFDNGGAVKFKFKHLLSRINIAPALKEDLMYVKDDTTKIDYEFGYELIKNEFIQVRKVELSGFKTEADITVRSAHLSTGNPDSTIFKIKEVEDSPKKTISFDIAEKDSPKILNNGDKESLLNEDAAIMMLPQTFGDDAQIKLEYTVNTDNPDLKELRSVIVPLKGHTLLPNSSYTLTFTIEKVYKGQIKDGSIEWILNNSLDAKEKWVSEDDIFSQGFDVNDVIK